MSKKTILYIIIIFIIISGFAFYGFTKATPPTIQTSTPLSQQVPINNLPSPTIEITPLSFDLGTVIYGDIATTTFTVINKGNQPLEILRLSTSCGCTSAQIQEKNKIIQPGETVPMTVSFDPAVHKDNTDLGDLTRVIYIQSNDPANPEIEVTINAFVTKKDN